jgi:hypothetical protein
MKLAHLIFVSLAAALVITASAGARQATFSNSVCKLVPAKDVLAIPGMGTGPCTESAPLQAPGATDYVGNWKGRLPTQGLQVTIEHYTDSGMLKLATNNLHQGLISLPKKVVGIGDAAYEAKGGAGGVEVKTVVGNYIAIIVLSNVKRPIKSPSVIEPLAKDVVAALGG